MTEVVVTGAGVVSPLGNDLETFARRMLSGESGIRSIRGDLVPEDFPVPYAGVVPRASLTEPSPRMEPLPGPLGDSQRFARDATAQAVAGIPEDLPFDGVIYGTAEGLNFEVVQETFRHDPESFWDRTLAEGAARSIVRWLRERGHGPGSENACIALSSACASGNQAIGLAAQRIQQGRWRRALVGGVDARVMPMNLMSFYLLSALAAEECPPERASRPFSSDRMGFVRSEGAASLVLEDRAEAEARGAEILARVAGYAHTTDAFHFTEGREDGSAVVAAMAGALRQAGAEPETVDLISAHGTSTALNDRLETAAIKGLFGDHAFRVPVTALKSQIGHATVAAGAIEAVSVLVMLREQQIAPTLNYREDAVDPDCDLDYVPGVARSARIRRVLSNSFGFGGHNTALVLEAVA